ncbi:ABC transporter substrate-binding protein [Paenibacillus sp. NPDC058071]|uniref:ABC transporter substrate-binding protein n=1 Tax=Paenibacillus sp. NPDC058071 TaxID=3346326 RepID=UPI0036D8462C
MKKVVVLGLTLMLLLAVVGCGKAAQKNDVPPAATNAANGSPEEAPAELNVLVFETPNLTAQYWDAAIKRFTDKHPNIKINKIVSPDIDRTKYAKQLLATGQFPDVLMSVNVSDFLASNSLLAFDEQYLDKVPGSRSLAIDGKVYKLPWGGQTIPYIYYNKKMFEEAGITAEPKTWAEFLDVVEKLKAAGKTPLLHGGAKDPWTTTMMLDAIISTDVYSVEPDWVNKRKNGEVKFSDPLFKDAVLKWKELHDSKSFNSDGLSIGYSQLQDAFLKGKGAMYPMGSWFIAAADAQTDIEIGVFPVPTDDGSVIIPYLVDGPASVSATTKYPEAAQLFASEFVIDSATILEVVKSDALIPLEGQDLEFTFSPLFQKVLDITNQGKKVNVFTWESGDAAMIAGMTDEINKSAQNIIMGKSVDSELSLLDQKWDDIAKRMVK